MCGLCTFAVAFVISRALFCIMKRCSHGRSKYRCKLCGTGYCTHGRQKAQCRECKRGYCLHGARKDRCPQCGTARCAHGYLRSRCVECQPLKKLMKLRSQCSACGVTQVCRLRMHARGGSGLCAECDGSSSSSSLAKEKRLTQELLKHGVPPPSAVDNVVVGGKTCEVGRRRPDLAWVTNGYIINLEIDEDSHTARHPSCEVRKAQDTRYGAEGGSKPLLLIRYNPDQYDGYNPQEPSAAESNRTAYLATLLKWVLYNVRREALDLHRPNVVYVYYHTRAAKHLTAVSKAGFPLIELPLHHHVRAVRYDPSCPIALKNLSILFAKSKAVVSAAEPAAKQRRALL